MSMDRCHPSRKLRTAASLLGRHRSTACWLLWALTGVNMGNFRKSGRSATGVIAPFGMCGHVFGIEKHIAKLPADIEVNLISEMR